MKVTGASARELEELVDLGSDLVLGKHPGPGVGDLLVGRDQDRDRLIGNPILLEDVFILVQPPQDVAGYEGSHRSRFGPLEVGLPGRRNEIDSVAVVSGYGVDDG